MATVIDYGPDSGGRKKGVSIVKPIVVGNVSTYFGKKRESDGHTHQWTLYLRPYLNEDYSTFIKKVHFKLHDSYANPVRILTKPPYEVTETGWGEFEAQVRIYFSDPTERPVTAYHVLKLFQSGTDATNQTPNQSQPLISETYDEIVFQEPTALMHSFLTVVRPITTGVWKHETDFEEKKKKSMEAIAAGRAKVKAEIQDLKERLHLARDTIVIFRDKLRDAEEQEKEAAAKGTADSK